MRTVLVLLILFVASAASAQFEDVVIKTTPLTTSLHMLEGYGGNLVLSSGEDGVFLVDDQFAPLTERILAAIAEITDEDVRFVLNTHWHGDHTGGNENIGQTGAVIVAHDNVRERMSVEQFSAFLDRTTPASPSIALPIVTFSEGIAFHLNGETIEVTHIESAHTDGDAIVHFHTANVIHTGDVVFWGLYPFIDVESGGSVDGVIAGCEVLLELGDADTRYVPGHGTIIGREELANYRDMLVQFRTAIAALIEQGKSLQEVQDAAPTAAYDEAWGQVWIDGDQMTQSIYNSLTR
ncbi:MBL fold metallo-hydrolase [bacterium]|nr:MAG: MBL fold metallo-hydrolase [bacterium]